MSQEKVLVELHQQALFQHLQTEALQTRTELATPTPEQIRAADQVFAQEEREAQQVVELLGVWSGVVLLNELSAVAPKDSEVDEDEPQRGDSQKPRV